MLTRGSAVALAVLSGTSVGCTEAVARPAQDAFLACVPRARVEAVAVIGRDGGVMQIGPHVLEIPAGALQSPVRIEAVAPADTIARIELRPEGLTFRRAASLTINTSHCTRRHTARARIVYIDDALHAVKRLSSMDLADNVRARLQHFSNYAVAW